MKTFRKTLLCLAILSSGAVLADDNPSNAPAASINEANQTTNPIPEWDQYFKMQLGEELLAQGIDLDKLSQERATILAEPDEKIALEQAREFYDRYRPYYEQAMINLKLSPEAIAAALLDNTHHFPNPSDYLSIINPGAYTCTNPLVIGLCNIYHNYGCSLQTIRPGGFNISPRSERTDRYQVNGSSSGDLLLWAHNIDLILSRDPTFHREIGVSFNSLGSNRVCVQARGHLNTFAVTTYRDHYFFSYASGSSNLQLIAKNEDVSGGSIGPEITYFPEPGTRYTAFGTLYLASRSDSNTTPVAVHPSHNIRSFGQTLPYSPYLIEDMVWVSSRGPFQQMMAFYQGALTEQYWGGSVDASLNFKLEEINILRVPNP